MIDIFCTGVNFHLCVMLDLQSVAALGLVSKATQSATKSREIWRAMCFRDYPPNEGFVHHATRSHHTWSALQPPSKLPSTLKLRFDYNWDAIHTDWTERYRLLRLQLGTIMSADEIFEQLLDTLKFNDQLLNSFGMAAQGVNMTKEAQIAVGRVLKNELGAVVLRPMPTGPESMALVVAARMLPGAALTVFDAAALAKRVTGGLTRAFIDAKKKPDQKLRLVAAAPPDREVSSVMGSVESRFSDSESDAEEDVGMAIEMGASDSGMYMSGMSCDSEPNLLPPVPSALRKCCFVLVHMPLKQKTRRTSEVETFSYSINEPIPDSSRISRLIAPTQLKASASTLASKAVRPLKKVALLKQAKSITMLGVLQESENVDSAMMEQCTELCQDLCPGLFVADGPSHSHRHLATMLHARVELGVLPAARRQCDFKYLLRLFGYCVAVCAVIAVFIILSTGFLGR